MKIKTQAYTLLILGLITNVLSQQLVQGVILDSYSGEPIVNANILIKGTDLGLTSDEKGRFLFDAPRPYPLTIVVNHIGYTSTEKTVYNSRSLQIDLWPHTIEFDPVDVSVVRLPAQYDVSSSKESMGASELRTRGIQDFQELTRSISSLVVSPGMTGTQTISIRGSNANETPVYLDGVKINDSFTNTADLSQINMDDVESIDVIKGASSLPYEVGAFGGVVNIYSHIPKFSQIMVAKAADLNEGTNGTTTGRLSYVADQFTVNAQIVKRSRLFRTFFDDVETDHLFASGMLNWKLALGNVRLKAISQEAQTLDSGSDAFTTSSKSQLYNMRYTGKLPALGENWQLEYGWRNDSFGVDFWEYGTNNPLYSQSPTGENSSYRLAKLVTLGATETLIQLAGNSEYYAGPSTTAIDSTFEKSVDLNLDRHDLSGTLVSKYVVEGDLKELDKLVFEFGLRYDDVGTSYSWDEHREYYEPGIDTPYRVVDITDEDQNNRYLVAKRLGMRLEGEIKSFKYTSYASLGNNSRLPTLQDEFLRKISTTPKYAETGLLKETVNTTDVGIDFSYKTQPGFPFTFIDGHINVFKNGYVNKLILRYIAGQPPVPVNALDATISGLEVSGKLHLPSKRGFLDFSSMFLSLNEPALFPGKPSYRHTTGFTLNKGRLSYNANMWWDGQKIYSSDDGLFVEPNHNLDFSVNMNKVMAHFTLNTTVSAKNILNYNATKENLFYNEQGYIITFYDQFQLLVNFRVSLH